ncbi:hypothetical protein Pcinc_017580 [Petrolisthes cinctipes]|uniref:Uncharacterized protein n=1 Tax=Petrolisthes cinctipes TaxID=88211 RepID=A0AAE1FNW4_PETCI|nr:hypothetical protein Pcinc_017580 [Petrolisthes cinctipes]
MGVWKRETKQLKVEVDAELSNGGGGNVELTNKRRGKENDDECLVKIKVAMFTLVDIPFSSMNPSLSLQPPRIFLPTLTSPRLHSPRLASPPLHSPPLHSPPLHSPHLAS